MTSRHLSNAHKLTSSFLLMTLFLALVVVSPQSSAAHVVTRGVLALTPAEPRITFDPADPGVTAGTKLTITAKLFGADGKEVTPSDADKNKWTWKIADHSLEEFLTVVNSNTNQASVIGLSGSNKAEIVRPNLIPIIVEFKGTPAATGVVNVHVNDAPLSGGPIPPGIEPQVDVMWAVMPQNITHDNFGGKIKKQYYGIEVVIGNDSGYDLELASVGFDLNTGTLDAGLKNSKIPTSGYRVTRASLQRKQQLSFRNFTLNTIKALGPVLTGFTPFFHNINHTNNFSEAINVLSNPIEKGLEMVWPDTTLNQLANLEDQSLRDNAITRTVVKNNTQVRFVVFVPKDLINDSRNDKSWRDKPLEVMRHLGRMILIGDQVDHINRVRVVKNADTGAAFSIAGQVADPCNKGIEGATITLTQGSGFNRTVKTDKDGKYIFENVPEGLLYTVTPSKEGTNFRTPSGNSFTLHGNRSGIDFTTEAATITISGTIKGADDKPVKEIIEVTLSTTNQSVHFKPKTEKTIEGVFAFSNVPRGAVYTVTPKPSSDDKVIKPGTVPTTNCGDEDEKKIEFKETAKVP